MFAALIVWMLLYFPTIPDNEPLVTIQDFPVINAECPGRTWRKTGGCDGYSAAGSVDVYDPYRENFAPLGPPVDSFHDDLNYDFHIDCAIMLSDIANEPGPPISWRDRDTARKSLPAR